MLISINKNNVTLCTFRLMNFEQAENMDHPHRKFFHCDKIYVHKQINVSVVFT